MADVKLELAREEEADARRGAQNAHEVTASRFLAMGLDLEEQQYVMLPKFKIVIVWLLS